MTSQLPLTPTKLFFSSKAVKVLIQVVTTFKISASVTYIETMTTQVTFITEIIIPHLFCSFRDHFYCFAYVIRLGNHFCDPTVIVL